MFEKERIPHRFPAWPAAAGLLTVLAFVWIAGPFPFCGMTGVLTGEVMAQDAVPADDGGDGSETGDGEDNAGGDEEEAVNDSLLAYIPELSWRQPGMDGRRLTREVAAKYPRGHFRERCLENGVWGVGEYLEFSVDYGFYQAGMATMSVLEKERVNGGMCYHIQTRANSNDFISKFYKVRDVVNSYIDTEGLFSRRFEKHLREGKYKDDRIVDFYHDRLIALNTKKKYAVTEIPLHVQDVLSALYFIRTLDLEVGRDEVLEVYADGKVYPLKVIVHGRDRVKVPAGTFNCLKIEPVLKSEGIFKQKGKLTVWLTDDNMKIPVKMTSKILIGSIGTNLVSMRFGEME